MSDALRTLADQVAALTRAVDDLTIVTRVHTAATEELRRTVLSFERRLLSVEVHVHQRDNRGRSEEATEPDMSRRFSSGPPPASTEDE